MIKTYGFTCGAFDVLHAGHILMLKECRQQCDALIVGLQSDPTIDRPEKNKPVQSLEERRIQLQGCRYVDYIVDYDTEADLLSLLAKYGEKNASILYSSMGPGYLYDSESRRRLHETEAFRYVRFIGADWKGKPYTGHDLKNLPVIFNSRDHGYSSSSLRKRIYEAELAKITGEKSGIQK